MVFAATPLDPLLGINFAVEFAQSEDVAANIGGPGVVGISVGFQEITGLESSLEIQEYKEGGRNQSTRKFISSANFGNITFKRGVLLTSELWDWYNQVRLGSFGARRELFISHLDTQARPVITWLVHRALPTKYQGPSWNSSQSSVAIESLEIVHEGLEVI